MAKFVSLKWLKRTPKIIIPIITGLSHFKTWKNQKQLNKFKRGIIKAAYTTELIYITNGYNMGISRLIGDAFREESLARRTTTNDYFSSSKGMTTAANSSYLHNHAAGKLGQADFFKDDSSKEAEELDKLVLIGIVSTSDLKYSELFESNASKRGVITYKIDDQDVNLNANANANSDGSKLDNYLNPDHTHFILVDDDNSDLKLIKFRVALEKRLQKPVIHKRSKRPAAHGNFDPSSLSNGSHSQSAQDPMAMMKPNLLDRNNSNNDTSASLPTTAVNGVDDNVGSPPGAVNTCPMIPIVCLLIGGGIGSISLVLSKIYQGIPILIFKGTGHAPDLISGTCEDFADR